MMHKECDNPPYHKSTLSEYGALWINRIGYVAALGIVFFALWTWFTLPPIVYPEAQVYGILEANTQIEGYFLSPENILSHTFDLKAHEYPQNAYRPRAGSFLFQYLDMNMMIWLRKMIPGWGYRYPFYILATLILPVTFFLLFRQMTDFRERGIIAGMSAMPVLFCNYSVSMSLELRSAKLLAPSFCLFVFYIFLRFLKENTRHTRRGKDWIVTVSMSIFVFFLMLFDETVIAAAVFFGAISIYLSIRAKKTSTSTLILNSAAFLYISYYFFWGRWLFQYYTRLPLIRHRHNFDDILRIDTSVLFQAIEVIYDPLSFNPFFFWTTLIVVLAGLPILIRKRESEAVLFSCACLLFSIILAVAQLCSHNPIYNAKAWHYGMYFLPSTMFFYMAGAYIYIYIYWKITKSRKLFPQKGVSLW